MRTLLVVSTRSNALWRQGWLYYQHGNFEQAHNTFDRILHQGYDERKAAKVRYWAGRSLANLGADEQAQKHYRRVAQDFPMTYYGQIARTRLSPIPTEVSEFAKEIPREWK